MNKKTVAVQPGANHRWVAGADRGSANQGRSSQPNFLTIKDQRVTRFEFNRENYNYILDQLSSALESKKFSSFSHSTAAALLYHCGRSKCTRFPEGLIPLVVRSISFSNDDNGAKSIGNAVYGLQNLAGSHETTHALVAALSSRITGKETCSWGDISNRIVHVSTGNVDKSVAHAELLACEDKNPTLFREPLGVESLIETGRLYHQWGVETESDRPCLVTLDLHHHVPGSIAPYLDFVLNHDDCFLSGYDRYALVVGKGLHSQHYESELKHAVVSYFQSSEWTVQIDTRNSGVVLVSRVAA